MVKRAKTQTYSIPGYSPFMSTQPLHLWHLFYSIPPKKRVHNLESIFIKWGFTRGEVLTKYFGGDKIFFSRALSIAIPNLQLSEPSHIHTAIASFLFILIAYAYSPDLL